MRGEALEVVFYGDAGGSTGMEAGEAAVFEGDIVVEADEFGEHVAD